MISPADRSYAEELLAFLNASPTAYHAAAGLAARLNGAGFRELREEDAWTIEPGGKYFLRRNGSALIAFEAGGSPAANGFRLIGAHTDSPGFKIKPGGTLRTGDGYTLINTEGYGGAILSSWFDRPLSIAGRVTVRTADPFRPESMLIDCRRPLAVIPNLCIHFNREVNSGYAYNKQIDLLPLLGLSADDTAGISPVLELAAEAAGTEPDSLLEHDLFLYDTAPGTLTGRDGEFLSASRIDNLSMAFAGLTALLGSGPSAAVKVLAVFDNEEVGSVSAPGADSSFLPHTLRRISLAARESEEDLYRALARSLAVSADCAHAVHPNHPEKHDPAERPVLGGGPAVKYSASQRYTSNAETAGVFIAVCRTAGVPCQKFVNRSDIPGGSTIGPALSSRCSIPSVDVGTPILAMHSVREFGSVMDTVYTAKAFETFYGYSG